MPIHWMRYQRVRLDFESHVLASELPSFRLRDTSEATYVNGTWESAKRARYRIRVELTPGYPDELPATYVTGSTGPLHGYHRPMEAYLNSASMHTWKTDKPGWVKICTMHEGLWSAHHSLPWLIRKALLWITAYECHLDDGRPINDFLVDHPR